MGLINGQEGRGPRGGVTDSNCSRNGFGIVDAVTEHDGCRAGRLEAPHLGQLGGLAGRVILREAAPVGRDVAGIADGNGENVRRFTEGVNEFEGTGLLTFDAVGVDRVHDGDGNVLSEFAGQRQSAVEVAADLDDFGAVHDGLSQLAERNLAFGDEHDAGHIGLGGEGGGGGRRVTGGATDNGLGARSLGLANGHGHTAVLKGAGGVSALNLQKDFGA